MSFTQDELQSFNTILEQKLGQQRRELERSFDQRMHVFKREIEQRLAFTQQELVRTLLQNLSEQYRKFKETLSQKIDAQQAFIASTTANGTDSKQQIEDIVERALDAQLISFDQLISERFTPADEVSEYSIEAVPDFAGIEVQTDIPWNELAEAVTKAFDERFSLFDESFRSSIKNIEYYLSVKLQSLREELVREQHERTSYMHDARNIQPFDGAITSMQDVLVSIERLEHIIESMQVAMTSNHALLSNRMYHHQQLPLERAHTRGQETTIQHANTTKSQLPLPKENEKQ
ncbi:MAG: hypothetical protein NVSMB38_09180 [Ktedonobacteraceae bacterium]